MSSFRGYNITENYGSEKLIGSIITKFILSKSSTIFFDLLVMVF